MFGCQPLYSWQSCLPLWWCDDRTNLGRRPKYGNGRKTSDHCTKFFRSRPLRVFCSWSDFRQVIEFFDFWVKQFIYPNNRSMFYISLHAVLPLPMLQNYQTGIPFIYTVRFVGDRWDEGEVERS